MTATLPARFWRHVDKTDGCWLWTGALNSRGYGCTSIASRSYLAHRIAYEALVGPIPEGLPLDHLCEVRRCVRPDHLDPVTVRENNIRAHAARIRRVVQQAWAT